jgi:hypothetical protein
MTERNLSFGEQVELDKVVDMVDYVMEKMANNETIARNRAIWVRTQFDEYLAQGFTREEAVEFLKSDLLSMNKK